MTTPTQKTPARVRRAQPRPVTFQPPTEPDEAETIAAKKAAVRKTAASVKAHHEPAIDEHDDDIPAPPEPEPEASNDAALEPFITPGVLNGLNVVREELVYTGLKTTSGERVPLRYSLLLLEDGTEVWACRDCWTTEKSRGLIMKHRNAAHGTRYGKKRVKGATPVQQGVLDLVLEPREDGTPAPAEPLDWTLRELLAMLPSIRAVGDLLERTEAERDRYRDELTTRNVNSHENQRKIDVYDSLRDEVLALRVWKKKIIKRFGDLGFVFNEEE